MLLLLLALPFCTPIPLLGLTVIYGVGLVKGGAEVMGWLRDLNGAWILSFSPPV